MKSFSGNDARYMVFFCLLDRVKFLKIIQGIADSNMFKGPT